MSDQKKATATVKKGPPAAVAEVQERDAATFRLNLKLTSSAGGSSAFDTDPGVWLTPDEAWSELQVFYTRAIDKISRARNALLQRDYRAVTNPPAKGESIRQRRVMTAAKKKKVE